MKPPSRPLVIRYLVVTGIFSGLLFALVASLAAAKAPQYVQTMAMNLSAWAPTLSVLALFRQLYPGQRLGGYLKRTLSARINPLTFVLLLVVQGGILALSILARLSTSGRAIGDLKFVGLSAAVVTLVVQLTSGAMGEELGWRGYLLRELRRRHSLMVSALLVGIVWGFWHFPMWFTHGYSGRDLVLYVAYFLLEILSLSVIMAVFYDRQENLVIAIWIHFLVNFPVGLVKMDVLQYLGWMSLGYAVFAIVLTIVGRKRLFERLPPAAQDKG